MAYEIKTKRNDSSVDKFVSEIEDDKRREECKIMLDFFRKQTGERGQMYGTSIVGFGDHSYMTKSGCNGNWFKVGFSPRKAALTLYVVPYVEEQQEMMKSIGKVKTGKSCIYVKKLDDIDLKILGKLIKMSMKTKGYAQ